MSVIETFERALEEILARVSISAVDPYLPEPEECQRLPSIATAYSGGLDSSVLLHLAQRYARTRGINLFAFHVHHGLSRNADDWLAHCRHEAERLGIVFDSSKIELADSGKTGIEEAARLGRYAALGELCRQHQVKLLLTAHHQDDQAETIMLQLLRGSGVPGLSGMDRANAAPALLGDAELIMARPLLDMPRAALEAYARDAALAHIEDESNDDPRYARNALRHHVMPMLSEFFPGYGQRLARTATHMQSAQRLLDALAAQDLRTCLDGDCLVIGPLKEFSSDRIDNLLRYWLSSRGMRMPSTAWLHEMRKQLMAAKEDAQICVMHPDGHVRRFQSRIYLTPTWQAEVNHAPPVEFRWNGETQISFPDYRGVLHFDFADEGLDSEWLAQQALQLRYRQGGERLKPAANRPTRTLKQHYQALEIPPWERAWLPLVLAREKLLYAAGIGMDCHHAGQASKRIRLRWQFA